MSATDPGRHAAGGAERPPERGERGGARAAQRHLGPVVLASVCSFVAHALAVVWLWHSWRGFGRGGVLAWIDFPSSLAFLRLRGGAKLAWSVLVGGAQWALIGAGLSLLVGQSARRPPGAG